MNIHSSYSFLIILSGRFRKRQTGAAHADLACTGRSRLIPSISPARRSRSERSARNSFQTRKPLGDYMFALHKYISLVSRFGNQKYYCELGVRMEIKNYEDDESFGSAARTAAEIKAGFYAIISCEELGQ